jgi:hypothetical protein
MAGSAGDVRSKSRQGACTDLAQGHCISLDCLVFEHPDQLKFLVPNSDAGRTSPCFSLLLSPHAMHGAAIKLVSAKMAIRRFVVSPFSFGREAPLLSQLIAQAFAAPIFGDHAACIIRSLQKVTSYPRLDDANGARNLTRPRRSLSSIRRIDVGP